MAPELPAANQDKPEAIRKLYHVFARYLARPSMPRCVHSAGAEEIARLCSRPLGDLSQGELANFAWHAMSTIGDAADFKHFLPRIFELMIWDGNLLDAEILVNKLTCATWRHWPAQEQQAISAFFFDWWKNLLSHYPAQHEAEECLCAISQAEDDLSRYLDYWRGCRNIEALLHLARTVGSQNGLLMSRPPTSPLLRENYTGPFVQILQWLLSPQTDQMLNEAVSKYAATEPAKMLSDACQQMQWVREALARNQSPP